MPALLFYVETEEEQQGRRASGAGYFPGGCKCFIISVFGGGKNSLRKASKFLGQEKFFSWPRK
ncbi:hypothetical protein JT26_00165 [Porphyromonas sp. COT-108 OH1349]|nr:hypothetical protein JT26_00165 [Porphyromonas sp. COT-108 OH1349]